MKLAPTIVGMLLLAGGIQSASAQNSTKPSRAQLLVAAREIAIAARFCTMVTNGPDGQPQARIVDPFNPDSTFTIWIGTNPLTRKVAELRKDPRVTLIYFNVSAFEYVTVHGRAVLSEAMADRAAHWKPEWARLYKDEYRGGDYLLIKVIPSRLEIVSTRRGINSDSLTWRPMRVDLP